MPTRTRLYCRRLHALRRRARTLLLRWLAAGAAIDEAHQATPLDERELAALAEAIDQARRAGR